MKREQLEHLIRACSTIAEDDELVIIGSQAILGQFPDAPDELLVSNEADIATLPLGWQQRLVPIHNARTRGATGWCLEVHDLVISKYAANREKDRVFVRAAIRHGLVERALLDERLAHTELEPELRALIVALLDRDFREADQN